MQAWLAALHGVRTSGFVNCRIPILPKQPHFADGLRNQTAFADSSTQCQRRILSMASEATCMLLRSKWV